MSSPLPPHPSVDRRPAQDLTRQGVLFGLSAYLIWGCFPLYFKGLVGAGLLEVVAHRIFWSLLFLLPIVVVRRQFGAIRQALANRSLLLTLTASTLLIATNWLIFIYAVDRKEVLQSSLGYFLNPLVSVMLGVFFLRERLNAIQGISILLASVAVTALTLHVGGLPWIALLLAVSFGIYGLLRKIARIDALIGLTVETLLLAPISLAYILFLHVQGESAFLAGSLQFDLLLPFAGVVTAVPLLLFVGAARRLRLATVGFLQYITPSLHFFWAVAVFNEPFSTFHLLCFLLIWLGLALYSGEALWQNRQCRINIPKPSQLP